MIVTLITLQRLQAQISRLSLLREAKNDDFLLTNTSIWKEKKKSWKSTSVHVQRLKFLVWKPRLGSASNSYNTGNFPHTPLPRSVHSRHSVSLAQCFSLSNFFYYPYLPYPPTYNKSISSGLWCGLHYMSVCIVKSYVLQQKVIGGEKGSKEEF